MLKQNIPIIVTNKKLKIFFTEIIDQLNRFFKYKFELLSLQLIESSISPVVIIDTMSLKNIDQSKLPNKTYFLIDSNFKVKRQNSNLIAVNSPLKISDFISQIEINIDQKIKQDQNKISFSQHTYDPSARIFSRGKNSIRFTEKENEIFNCFVENKNSKLSKKYLLKTVWEYDQGIDTHTLETHLYSLRKKIENKLGTKNLIKYEEKKGYWIDQSLL